MTALERALARAEQAGIKRNWMQVGDLRMHYARFGQGRPLLRLLGRLRPSYSVGSLSHCAISNSRLISGNAARVAPPLDLAGAGWRLTRAAK